MGKRSRAEAQLRAVLPFVEASTTPSGVFGKIFEERMALLDRHFKINEYLQKGARDPALTIRYADMRSVIEQSVPTNPDPEFLFSEFMGDQPFVLDTHNSDANAYTFLAGWRQRGKIHPPSGRRLDRIYLCESLDRTSDQNYEQIVVHELAHFVATGAGDHRPGLRLDQRPAHDASVGNAARVQCPELHDVRHRVPLWEAKQSPGIVESPSRIVIRRRSELPSGVFMFRELDVGQSALLTDIAMCINYYRLFSPGLYCCIHSIVEFDDGKRFCPGIIVQVNHGPLRQCDPAVGRLLQRTAQFHSGRLRRRRSGRVRTQARSFERAQVFEYVAARLTDPVEWTWNRLVDGKFSVIEAADNELILSAALPGLWIPSFALKHRNWWSIMAAIARGVSRVGHHQFMDTICGRPRTEEENRQVILDYRSGQMGEGHNKVDRSANDRKEIRATVRKWLPFGAALPRQTAATTPKGFNNKAQGRERSERTLGKVMPRSMEL